MKLTPLASLSADYHILRSASSRKDFWWCGGTVNVSRGSAPTRSPPPPAEYTPAPPSSSGKVKRTLNETETRGRSPWWPTT